MQAPVKSLVSRADIGTTANVVQHSTLRISRLVLDSPALVLLRHGKKTLQSGGRRWTLQGGDAVVVAGGQTFDVQNELSERGLFEARWLVWDRAVIDDFQPDRPEVQPLSQAAVLRDVAHEFSASVDRAVDAIADVSQIPGEVAKHRLAEVLVWLARQDVTLASPLSTTMVARLRRMFAASISQPWTMSAAASRLAVSQATLRRRLDAEGASFGELLTDARMSLAMTLLQSTDRAVARVAADVGYESASRFSVRFRARFGFAPTAIRGHRRSAG